MKCRLRSLWGTVTMGAFWRSLVNGPLVVFDGHVWGEPVWRSQWYSEDGIPGRRIEFGEARCIDCGAVDRGWRRYYGTVA